MKGFRFYLEHDSSYKKRKGQNAGNVLAVSTTDSWVSGHDVMSECIGGIYAGPDSAVCGTAVSWDYLRLKCKRIPEARARQIHPALFQRLDASE